MFNKNQNLINKRNNLLEENKLLRAEYEDKYEFSKTNDIIASMKKRTRDRGGKYGDIIYRSDYKSKWKGTFFDTQRILIESLPAYPLDRLELFLNGNLDNPYGNLYDECAASLIGYCDLVMPSKFGPIIRITDPYGSYTFPPLKKTPYEEAQKWIGRILIVEALYQYERKNPIVTNTKVLSFTLNKDLRKIC